MNLKFIIFIIFNMNLLHIRICEYIDNDDNDIIGQIDNIQKSLGMINRRLDIVTNRYTSLMDQKVFQKESIENQNRISKPIFDIRFDTMPEHCSTNQQPSTCAEATNCTLSSGIYNLTDTRYSNNAYLAYCDNESYGGDWLYILKIIDGTENFDRPWQDYVNGFGDINGEFWLGLDKLHALTNFYGPQELNIHLENFKGRRAFARYDNFVVGNDNEKYKLKSLGRYWGTIGDDLHVNVGQAFSTYDNDNDKFTRNCAKLRKAAFWFSNCGLVNPTGPYIRGEYNSSVEGSYWNSFEGLHYAPKTIIFMIRRRSAEKLN